MIMPFPLAKAWPLLIKMGNGVYQQKCMLLIEPQFEMAYWFSEA